MSGDPLIPQFMPHPFPPRPSAVFPVVSAEGGGVGTRGEAVAASSPGVLAAGRGAGADRHAARTVHHLRVIAAVARDVDMHQRIGICAARRRPGNVDLVEGVVERRQRTAELVVETALDQLGRASCRVEELQYVLTTLFVVALKIKTYKNN